MSDLIDSHLYCVLDSDHDRIQSLNDVMTSLSSFTDFLRDLLDEYVASIVQPGASLALFHSMWSDIKQDKDLRWLWNYAQDELDDLKSSQCDAGECVGCESKEIAFTNCGGKENVSMCKECFT